MKYFVLLAASVVIVSGAAAQRTIDITKSDANISSLFYAINGEPFVTTKFVKLIEGTPYFKDEWMKSTIVLPNGNEYKDIQAKVNLLENTVHYLDEKGRELVSMSHVKEVVLKQEQDDVLYRFIYSSYLPPAATPVKEGWYLWLHSGKASLFKYFSKELFTQKPYGSATEEQRVNTKESYFIFYNNAVFNAKKLKEVPALLTSKREELEAFIRKGNSAASPDDQFTALIAHFNFLLNK